MHANTPLILKPIGPSAAVSCVSLVIAGAVLLWKALDRLLSLRRCQRVFSWAHHDNSLQARVDLSCMSHTHIRGNITLIVCVRLQTAPKIPFYGQGLCVCINTQSVWETWALVYFVGISHVLRQVAVLSVCLCIHLLPVINSCHYGQWGRCKSAFPGPSDGLQNPSACWYTETCDEVLST